MVNVCLCVLSQWVWTSSPNLLHLVIAHESTFLDSLITGKLFFPNKQVPHFTLHESPLTHCVRLCRPQFSYFSHLCFSFCPEVSDTNYHGSTVGLVLKSFITSFVCAFVSSRRPTGLSFGQLRKRSGPTSKLLDVRLLNVFEQLSFCP